MIFFQEIVDWVVILRILCVGWLLVQVAVTALIVSWMMICWGDCCFLGLNFMIYIWVSFIVVELEFVLDELFTILKIFIGDVFSSQFGFRSDTLSEVRVVHGTLLQ